MDQSKTMRLTWRRRAFVGGEIHRVKQLRSTGRPFKKRPARLTLIACGCSHTPTVGSEVSIYVLTLSDLSETRQAQVSHTGCGKNSPEQLVVGR